MEYVPRSYHGIVKIINLARLCWEHDQTFFCCSYPGMIKYMRIGLFEVLNFIQWDMAKPCCDVVFFISPSLGITRSFHGIRQKRERLRA